MNSARWWRKCPSLPAAGCDVRAQPAGDTVASAGGAEFAKALAIASHQELHPLRLHLGVVLGRFHRLQPAGNGGVETLLKLRILQAPITAERLVRLREREHVRIHPRAQVLERNAQ